MTISQGFHFYLWTSRCISSSQYTIHLLAFEKYKHFKENNSVLISVITSLRVGYS